MKVLKIACNERSFEIKKEIIVYLLYRLTGKDYKDSNDKELLKAMEKYKLIDEITLESLTKA